MIYEYSTISLTPLLVCLLSRKMVVDFSIYMYTYILHICLYETIKKNNHPTKIGHVFEKEWRKWSGRHWRKRENKNKEKVNARDHQGDWKEEIKGAKLCNYFFLNKIMYNKIKQKHHNKVGQSKPTEGKTPKRKYGNQRHTYSNTQESHKSTNLKSEDLVYVEVYVSVFICISIYTCACCLSLCEFI